MDKEAYYFSHDSNARNDDKLIAVRMRHGAEGYGIYFMILERLRDNSDYMSVKDYNVIAFDLRVSAEKIKSVVEDFDLFVFTEDGKKFYSESLLRRMDKKESVSDVRRKAAKKRWEKEKKNKSSANAMQMQPKSNAIKRKESKGKERKESKGKESSAYARDELILPFDSENFQKNWQLWRDYKAKEHQFRYKTPQSEQAALNQLVKLGGEREDICIAIIHQSLANGWKGFFELKNQSNGNKKYDFDRLTRAVEKYNKD